MKFSFALPNPEFDKRIQGLIDLGEKQGGFITQEQYLAGLKGVQIFDTQAELIAERLGSKGIVVKTPSLTDDDKRRLGRERYFIADREVNLEGVTQEDSCLTGDEFASFFVAKYARIPKEERKGIKQALANKIVHVQGCKKCMTLCAYGYEIMETCFADEPFENEKFFAIFDQRFKPIEKTQAKRIQLENKRQG